MISVLHCNTIVVEGKATAAVLFYVREFCGFQLCTVVHCYAKWATDVPVILFSNIMLAIGLLTTNQAVWDSNLSGALSNIIPF